MKKSIIAIIIALCAIAVVVVVLVAIKGNRGTASNGVSTTQNTTAEEMDAEDEFVVELEEGWEGEMR